MYIYIYIYMAFCVIPWGDTHGILWVLTPRCLRFPLITKALRQRRPAEDGAGEEYKAEEVQDQEEELPRRDHGFAAPCGSLKGWSCHLSLVANLRKQLWKSCKA